MDLEGSAEVARRNENVKASIIGLSFCPYPMHIYV